MKKLIVIIIIVIIASIIGYNYIYQDHRNIKEEQAAFTTTAIMLSNEFSIDPSTSEKKYLNKTIEVSGTITAKSDNTITLDNTVFCQLSQNIDIKLSPNAPIKIKGRVIGYDDLLEEIKLDQCSITN
ncbi:OB-fold putative lipoprotein [Aestuariivivens insulae]|uniref:OB-fold putative lipoprotein n=1 Tax=Aestuariivivens insulae TaxID=1621988 RepID=UPI001F5AA595|nr:OB-fold putative lipoprotein [Aestuariivivens insulae]